MKILLFILASTFCVWNVQAQKVTAYGYPGDTTGDSNSRNGIGNHDNTLTAYGSGGFTSAAVTPEFAAQYGLGLGQQFTFTAANGQTFNLKYDDTVPTGGVNQQPAGSQVVDIYDPHSLLTNGGNDNNFSTSVQGDSLTLGTGTGSSAPMGQGLPGISPQGNGAAQQLNEQIIAPLIAKFQNASAAWAAPLTKGATWLFWILAVISLVWTGLGMFVRGTTLMEIVIEILRYIITIGLFFWFLTNGAVFAMDIINSLRQLGGQAAGTGQQIFPGDVVSLGLQLTQAQNNWITWIVPGAAILPSIISAIVLFVCILIAANMILLIISAWIVAYAGVVVLGFGSSPWTRDIAINYLRTALGVGLRLMTMELVVGIGIQFLQSLIQQMGGYGAITNIGSLMLLTVAVIILAVLSHRLPLEVAGMVTGAGYHGGIGTMGVIGAALATSTISRGAVGVGGAINSVVNASHEKLKKAASAGSDGTASSRNGSGGASANPRVPTESNKV